MDPKTEKLSRLELKTKLILSLFIITKLFCFYTKFVTSIFQQFAISRFFCESSCFFAFLHVSSRFYHFWGKQRQIDSVIVYLYETFLSLHHVCNQRILVASNFAFFSRFLIFFDFFFDASNFINAQLFCYQITLICYGSADYTIA